MLIPYHEVDSAGRQAAIGAALAINQSICLYNPTEPPGLLRSTYTYRAINQLPGMPRSLIKLPGPLRSSTGMTITDPAGASLEFTAHVGHRLVTLAKESASDLAITADMGYGERGAQAMTPMDGITYITSEGQLFVAGVDPTPQGTTIYRFTYDPSLAELSRLMSDRTIIQQARKGRSGQSTPVNVTQLPAVVQAMLGAFA